MKPIEIHQQLSETCNDGVMDVKNVRSWVRQFKEGRTSCENKLKEPRPRTSRSEDMIAHDFRIFSSSCKIVSTDPTDMPALTAILFHSQAAVFHNHLFHSCKRNRDSCREYFKILKILPLQSQYLLSLLIFVADNRDYFRLNSEIHSFNTKNKSNLHPPPSKLTVFQRGPYYSGIKAFNNLPTYVKNLLQTKKQFK